MQKQREMKSEKHPLQALIIQFIKFGFVGICNTGIGLLIYYFLLAVEVPYLAANVVGFLFSTLNAYLMNQRFVFQHTKRTISKRSTVRRIGKVYLVYLISFGIGMADLYIFVEWLKISEKIAPLLNICITTPLNYLLNKFWAFKK